MHLDRWMILSIDLVDNVESKYPGRSLHVNFQCRFFYIFYRYFLSKCASCCAEDLTSEFRGCKTWSSMELNWLHTALLDNDQTFFFILCCYSSFNKWWSTFFFLFFWWWKNCEMKKKHNNLHIYVLFSTFDRISNYYWIKTSLLISKEVDSRWKGWKERERKEISLCTSLIITFFFLWNFCRTHENGCD